MHRREDLEQALRGRGIDPVNFESHLKLIPQVKSADTNRNRIGSFIPKQINRHKKAYDMKHAPMAYIDT